VTSTIWVLMVDLATYPACCAERRCLGRAEGWDWIASTATRLGRELEQRRWERAWQDEVKTRPTCEYQFERGAKPVEIQPGPDDPEEGMSFWLVTCIGHTAMGRGS